jgi:hypothetical protein
LPDIPAISTLASYGQTLLAAAGVPSATIASQIFSGQVIAPALA